MSGKRGWLLVAIAAGAGLGAWLGPAGAGWAAGEKDVKEQFAPPVRLVDQDGKAIVTGLGNGHPIVWDYDRDGANDILLGCKTSMMTVQVQGLLLRNVGTNAAPRFQWPAKDTIRLQGAELTFTCGGGCNTGAAFEPHPVDWNGDGHVDLLVNSYSSTGTGAFILENTGAAGAVPTFIRRPKVFLIRSHGWGSGGGDWNSDGLPDFAHNVNPIGWQVHLGVRGAGGAVQFGKGPALLSEDYQIIGHEQYTTPKRTTPPWFSFAPYAGNLTGRFPAAERLTTVETHECPECRHKVAMPAGSAAVEMAAVVDDPLRPGSSHINYYWLDHKARTCTLKARLAEVEADGVRLSLGDLNGDGSTDIVYSGGVGGNQKARTSIWVMYGRAPGTAAKISPRPAASPAPPAVALPKARTPAGEVDLKALFAEPVALTDQDGKAIVTRRATGCPTVFDYSGDGKPDLLLGCYTDMGGTASEVLFIENVGTAGEPRFRWPAGRSMKTIMFEGGEKPHVLAVDHRGSATLEVHAVDQNADGHFDLLVNTGKHRGLDVFLLHNTGKGRSEPTFGPFSRYQNIVVGLPQCSGGGDWNGDGIGDYAHLVNAEGWQVHFGTRQTKGLPALAVQANLSATGYRMVGQKTWFDRTPQAWNFSGRNAPQADAPGTLNQTCRFCQGPLACRMHWPVTEIIASMDAGEAKDPAARASSINYYWLDHAAGTCTLKGALATPPIAAARLGIGDLNADGCMDVVFTGGLSAAGEETKIYVMYGKVRNVPGR